MKIFTYNIFPYLFPTMIIGNILSNTNISIIIPKFIKKIFYKYFNFDDIKTSIFILSIFCGSPTSSNIINNYYDKNLIDDDEVKYLTYITQFINPLFIIGSVGIGIFNSKKIGFLLFILLILNNLRKAYKYKKHFKHKKINTNIDNINITKDLITSINNTISSCLIIFSLVIIFSILTILITKIFKLNNTLSLIINLILEITKGLNELKMFNINLYIKILLAFISLNLGGICIQMQTLFINKNKKIRYTSYLINRII